MPTTHTPPRSVAEIEVRGSLVAVAEDRIAAPIEVVWQVLSALDEWPRWNTAVRSMRADDGARDGAVFRWRAGPGTITSTVLRAEPPTGIAWRGRTLGIEALHVWRLEAHGADTVVRTEESYSGLVARLFRPLLRRALEQALEQGLADLKVESERRAAR